MAATRTKILFTILNHHQRKLSRLDIPEARRYFEKISRTYLRPSVRHVYEQHITSQGQPLRLRIYEGDRTKPTMIYFHGGGFVVGSINSHDAVARYLCRTTKSTVISVNYRLAPEHPRPAASDDGLATITWLEQSELNHDFVLAGDSAGGQIALMVSIGVRLPSRGAFLSL